MPNLDTGKAFKSFLECGIALLVGWHCAFDSGTALLAGELQNLKTSRNFKISLSYIHCK